MLMWKLWDMTGNLRRLGSLQKQKVATGSTLVNGVTRPDETIPALGPQPTDPEPQKNPFVDVEEGRFYYEPVLWAVEKGITSGVDATHFMPDANCTRGQVVTFLWRSQGCPEPTGTETPFVDVSSNRFYYKAVLWALKTGLQREWTPPILRLSVT